MVNSAMCSATWWAVLPSAKHTQEHHWLPLQVLKGIHRVQFPIKGWYPAKISFPVNFQFQTHTGANTWSTWTCPASTNIPLLLTTMTSFTALRLSSWFECWCWAKPFVAPQVKEHYLNLIEDAVRELPSLVNLNLGTLVNNGILRIVSKTCPRYWR